MALTLHAINEQMRCPICVAANDLKGSYALTDAITCGGCRTTFRLVDALHPDHRLARGNPEYEVALGVAIAADEGGGAVKERANKLSPGRRRGRRRGGGEADEGSLP